ncbi:fimbria/pilus outer membrane usher protein [Escherichia coli]
MLPPNLRGYGARHFRRGTHHSKGDRQPDGRDLRKRRFLAGPFRIQDLGDSVSGTLHIRIEEQNGQVQEYDISTASMRHHLPLTRFAIRS